MADKRTPSHDFIVKYGATFKTRIRIKVNGIVQSLDEAIARFFVRPKDSIEFLDLSSDDPAVEQYVIINTTDPDDNFVEIFFSDEITIFEWKYADFRLDITTSDGTLRRKLKGRLIMEFAPN